MYYRFTEGDRVRKVDEFTKTGTVSTTVPGNGSLPWYYVDFDDGSSDRFTEDELESE